MLEPQNIDQVRYVLLTLKHLPDHYGEKFTYGAMDPDLSYQLYDEFEIPLTSVVSPRVIVFDYNLTAYWDMITLDQLELGLDGILKAKLKPKTVPSRLIKLVKRKLHYLYM